MTVTTLTNKITHVGDGIATVFPYDFLVLAESHLFVQLDSVPTTTGFTIQNDIGNSNGTVTFDVAPANNVVIVLIRIVPLTQEIDYTAFDAFPAETHEKGLDLGVMRDQQSEELDTRALRVPVEDPAVNTIPNATTRATKLLGFDDAGQPIVSDSTVDDVDAVVAAGLQTGQLMSSHSFIGDGATVSFVIGGIIINHAASILAFIDGVSQNPDVDYTVGNAGTDTTVTFTTAPPNLSDVRLHTVGFAKPVGAADASNVTYIPHDGIPGVFGRAVDSRLDERCSVLNFGAKGDESQDDAPAIQAALDSGLTSIYVPQGRYRCDSPITVNSNIGLFMEPGAFLLRLTAFSADTLPVVYVLGSRSTFDAGGGVVASENNSPDGVVCLGHKDNNDPNNAANWAFRNCTVHGEVTSSVGNVGVNIPSGQVNQSSSNFFGNISNINIRYAGIGMLFREIANAHNVDGIQFRSIRTACLELRGSIENNITNMFMHAGAADGLYGVLLNNKLVGAAEECTLNCITNWAMETGGAGDIAVGIQSLCSKNTIIGNDNVPVGFSIANTDNFVCLSGIVRFCTAIFADNVNVDGLAFPAIQVPSADPNTMDDYEEGTWTVTPTGITGTNTYIGTYTKIGNRIDWEVIINTTDTIATVAGTSKVSLPILPAGAGSFTCTMANRSTGLGYLSGLVNTTAPTGVAFLPTASPSPAQSLVAAGSYSV